MGIVDTRGDQAPAEALKEAAEALRAGFVVALPTDTVYGLAADASVPGATDRVFEVKNRPDASPSGCRRHTDQALGLATAVPSRRSR